MSAGECGGEGFHSPMGVVVAVVWVGWGGREGRGWVDDEDGAGAQMGAG
jgi:hypothetical protein